MPLVLLVALSSLLLGCGVAPPGKLETAFITRVKRSITVGGAKDLNPLAATPENIQAGQQQFQNNCTACHGSDGRNTGVVFADQMSPPVPPLDSATVQRYSDGQIKWIIANGISPSGMPAWKKSLDDGEMWQIVLFIRHLPPQT